MRGPEAGGRRRTASSLSRAALALFTFLGVSRLHAQDLLTADDVVRLTAPEPDRVVAYGPDPLQRGRLRVPAGEGPHPVIVFLHGGCWLAEYDIEHVGPLEVALAEAGYAVWSLEYRRVGDEGGGWPGTFEDVAAGADALRSLAGPHGLDLTRVVASGHSAGGHLALWLAARPRLPAGSALHTPDPLALHGVLALAPAADLGSHFQSGICDDAVGRLMGGGPTEVPDRYRLVSPMRLAPLNVPQRIVIGVFDEAWGPSGRRYAELAAARGDDVTVVEATGSGHFEMIVPTTSTWPLVLESFRTLFGRIAGARE